MPRHKKRAPSFKGRKASSEAASLAKSRNKSHDTRSEVLLRSTLWRRGLRFRKNVSQLPGRPDIVFPRRRVAVFCDGDFWHGRDWTKRRSKLRKGANADYWVSKIETNMERDQHVDARLKSLGWRTLRLWETDILKDPESAARRVVDLVQEYPLSTRASQA